MRGERRPPKKAKRVTSARDKVTALLFANVIELWKEVTDGSVGYLKTALLLVSLYACVTKHEGPRNASIGML